MWARHRHLDTSPSDISEHDWNQNHPEQHVFEPFRERLAAGVLIIWRCAHLHRAFRFFAFRGVSFHGFGFGGSCSTFM
jgi:hypothetical protein